MRIGLFALAFAMCASAMAQEEQGPYVGLGLALLDFEEGEGLLTFEDEPLFSKVYAGYRFRDNWSVEGSYGQSSSIDSSVTNFPSTTPTLQLDYTADFDIRQVRGLKHFGKFFVGVGVWEADRDSTLIATPSSPFGPINLSDSDSGASVVIGGQWDLGRITIRAEFERFDTDNLIDASTVGAALHFRF